MTHPCRDVLANEGGIRFFPTLSLALSSTIISPNWSFHFLPSHHAMHGATRTQIDKYRAHVGPFLWFKPVKIHLHWLDKLFTQEFIDKNSSLFLDEAWINPPLLQSFLAANPTGTRVSTCFGPPYEPLIFLLVTINFVVVRHASHGLSQDR
jgi:hypothetical protein